MNSTYLTFKIGKESYIINVENVVNIIEMVDITKIPNTPKHVIGMIDFRGNPLLIVDAHKVLNIKFKEFTQKTCIVILKINNDMFGIIVDDVKSVIDVDSKNIINNKSSKYIIGMVNIDDELTMILDINKLIK
ncbi:chemotaxis protein CheW [Trichloromonas sp.]|uniref:chemotaxis protein CheW n=1 Tax=Trichloromonas sp. TaxID=3069249 RepID=UPI002A393DF4|nr:chemotaxis protein CheW [Trichloromonas sp.]